MPGFLWTVTRPSCKLSSKESPLWSSSYEPPFSRWPQLLISLARGLMKHRVLTLSVSLPTTPESWSTTLGRCGFCSVHLFVILMSNVVLINAVIHLKFVLLESKNSPLSNLLIYPHQAGIAFHKLIHTLVRVQYKLEKLTT